jgi:hypothetical protein
MPTSVYFNNYNSRNEQGLFEDIIVESIRIQGFDAYYLPNENDESRDLLFGEDPLKKFTSAFPVEMYLSSALEYTGEKDFFSKFGLEIRNNVSVILSKRTFSQRVPQNKFTRPRDGDLIYVPVLYGTGEIYEIKFVDHTKDFFTLGRKIPYFYELQLEKFKYSNEIINTGIPGADIVNLQDSYTIDLVMQTGDSDYFTKEVVYQGSSYANANVVAVVSDWDSNNKILHVTNIAGEFKANANVIGLSSNTSILLSSLDPLDVSLTREVYDNRIIQNEADQIIDFSEANPFGEI